MCAYLFCVQSIVYDVCVVDLSMRLKANCEGKVKDNGNNTYRALSSGSTLTHPNGVSIAICFGRLIFLKLMLKQCLLVLLGSVIYYRKVQNHHSREMHIENVRFTFAIHTPIHIGDDIRLHSWFYITQNKHLPYRFTVCSLSLFFRQFENNTEC